MCLDFSPCGRWLAVRGWGHARVEELEAAFCADELAQGEREINSVVDGLKRRPSMVAAAQAAVTFCSVKEKDQTRALQMCEEDAGLNSLNRTDAPLFDMEIRGVPALKFFGDQVWR